MKEPNYLLGIAILVLLLVLLAPTMHQPPSAEEVHAAHPEWSLTDCLRIADGLIWLGATDEQVRLSWGRPDTVNRSVGSWGVHEQWVYRHGDYSGSYLYFGNGVLASWQT